MRIHDRAGHPTAEVYELRSRCDLDDPDMLKTTAPRCPAGCSWPAW